MEVEDWRIYWVVLEYPLHTNRITRGEERPDDHDTLLVQTTRSSNLETRISHLERYLMREPCPLGQVIEYSYPFPS